MSFQRERVFKRNMDSLDPLFEYVSEFVADHRVDADTAFVLKLAVEEAFTNLIKYDSSAAPEIPIMLAAESGQVVAVLRNIDGQEFDVTKAGTVDVEAPLERRTVGGLGLHLIRQMVDDLQYEYKDGVGIITITKSREHKRV